MNVFEDSGCVLHHGDYTKRLGSVRDVDLFLTSPPYNIGSRGVRKDGFRKLGKFDPKSFGSIRGYSDALPEDVYQAQQRDFFLSFCLPRLSDNGVILYNHKNRHRGKKLISPLQWLPLDKLTLHDEITLIRGCTHNHEKSFEDPCTERLYILKRSPSSKIYFDKRVTDEFKNTKDFWWFPIQRTRQENRHCAPFDLSFARECVFRWCPPGGLVCDPYCGSGTSMLASWFERRRFVGAERERKYFDQSVSRFQVTVSLPAQKVS